jgi:hypothetical protein
MQRVAQQQTSLRQQFHMHSPHGQKSMPKPFIREPIAVLMEGLLSADSNQASYFRELACRHPFSLEGPGG